jgi:hypothetical protein
MTDTTPIPLESRICVTLMTAGILGCNGEHPRCIGRECSKYESCVFELIYYQKESVKMQKPPQPSRKILGKKPEEP